MKTFFRHNGLSLVLVALFLVFLTGQVASGLLDYNDEREAKGEPPIALAAYLTSGHFIEATMENWESEFLQMAAYVMLTAFLFQKGSAESKDPDAYEAVDRRPLPRADAPGPVQRGGWRLKVYEHSLSLALLSLFFFSFALHALGGAAEYNEELMERGESAVSTLGYLATSRFWFESFQNWQSEFFSIWVMIVLSIFLRQRGSPESKPVDSPHGQTGTQ